MDDFNIIYQYFGPDLLAQLVNIALVGAKIVVGRTMNLDDIQCFVLKLSKLQVPKTLKSFNSICMNFPDSNGNCIS